MTYIHPDGTRVESEDDGRVILFDGEDPVVDLYPSCAAAIHAAFLDSLGLWLDEPTGCLVDTASRRPAPSQGGSYNVLRREPGGHMETDYGWTGQIHPDERDQAVDRYVATLRIDNARRVRDLAQEVVQLIDAATARAHRDREAINAYWAERGEGPLTGQPSITGTPEAGALRRRSMDLTRALAELRKS